MERNGDSHKENSNSERRQARRGGKTNLGADAVEMSEEDRKKERQDAIEESDESTRVAVPNDTQIKKLDRRARVIQLRTAGFSLSQIATALKVSVETVYAEYKKAIANKNEELHESTEALQFVTHNRAEVMINRLWQKAMPNNMAEPLGLEAMDRIIRLMHLDAKVMGYESPQKRQVDVQMISTSVSVVVEHIIRAIPEEFVNDVYKALDEGMMEVESLADKTAKAIPVKNTA